METKEAVDQCKHIPADLMVHETTGTASDGYGSRDTFYNYALQCNNCKLASVELISHSRGHYHLSVDMYEQVTGRKMSLREMTNIFRENNNIFHQIVGEGVGYLKAAVMESPGLEEDVRQAREDVKAALAKLDALLDQYEGRTEPKHRNNYERKLY